MYGIGAANNHEKLMELHRSQGVPERSVGFSTLEQTMNVILDEIAHHRAEEDCPACRAQEIIERALLPAAAAWESNESLPRFSFALHGAAGLLGMMLEEGLSRQDIAPALSTVLDDIERQIIEKRVLGGPTQGSA